MKILFVGFWDGFDPRKDRMLKYIENHEVTHDNELKNTEPLNYDIIIVGSLIKDKTFKKLQNASNILLYITEPIEKFNSNVYSIFTSKKFARCFGCINQSPVHNLVKYPLFFLYGFSPESIKNTNEYIKNITREQILGKQFATLINSHDMGETRKCIYEGLKDIGEIICPGRLLNNCSNAELNKIGDVEYRKKFLFIICPENFVVKMEGYITEKIYLACAAGAIPIYYGKLDLIDKQIFNMNRVIWYDPTDKSSIQEAINKVKYLMANPDKLVEFYVQQVFADTAIDVYNSMDENMQKMFDSFVKT